MLPGRYASTAFVLLAILIGTPRPLAAHARLERSVPAAGERLAAPPAELRLVFSEPVDFRYTSLTLRAPAGDVIALEPLRPDPRAGGREFFTPAPRFRSTGQYRVEWRTMAADGHVINGAFSFTVLAGAIAPAPVSQAPAAPRIDPLAHRVPAASLPPVFRQQAWPSVLVRFLEFAAIIAIIGTAAFRTFLLPGAGLMPTVHGRLVQGVRRVGLAAVLLLLLVLPIRLWLQSAAMHGPGLALEPEFLGALLARVTWGHAWLAQAALTLLAGVALLTGLVPLLALAATGLALTPAFQGHALAVEHWGTMAIAADAVHVLAAGTWIGTLLVTVAGALPPLFHQGLERGGHDTARLVARFSPLALVSVALLAAAGVASAALRFHVPQELITTAYGRTLLLKIAIVLLVLAAGWFNWRRARPALPSHAGVRALRRAAAFELLLAFAALAVTASLVALPTP